MTLAQAAQRAIQLGGKYDGHESPEDMNKLHQGFGRSALAGQGLVAAAKDKYPRDGQTFSFVACFAEVEVDIETGKYHIMDFLAVADVGTVMHPRRWAARFWAGRCWAWATRIGQKWVFDPQYGLTVSHALLSNQAADDSRRARGYAVGGAGHSRSGNAGRRARHWRAAGRRRMRRNFERTFGCAGR